MTDLLRKSTKKRGTIGISFNALFNPVFYNGVSSALLEDLILYPVFTYKTDAMKKLQQLAARGGYSRYKHGIIETKELEALLYKFEDRYRINATKQMRYRAKKRGEANTEIVLLQEGYHVHFWLMVSPGFGAVVDLEKPREITHKRYRLEITGYELVRVQKADAIRWTWRMTKENYADFEQRIKDACRHKNKDVIAQAVYSLERMPSFSEMRQQAFSLFKVLKAEYKRSHKTEYSGDLIKNFYGRFKTPQTLSAVDISRKARRVMSHERKQLRIALRAEKEALKKQIADAQARFDEMFTGNRESTSEIALMDKMEIDYLESQLIDLELSYEKTFD